MKKNWLVKLFPSRNDETDNSNIQQKNHALFGFTKPIINYILNTYFLCLHFFFELFLLRVCLLDLDILGETFL